MDSQNVVPAFYLSGIKGFHTGSRLERISDEHRTVMSGLAEVQAAGILKVEANELRPDERLVEELAKQIGRLDIQVLHLAGTLKQEDGMSEWASMTSVLSCFPNLELVFLSGSGSRELVRFFLEAGVPIVMATSFPYLEDNSMIGIKAFYYGLANGMTISQAFEEMALADEMLWQTGEGIYSVDLNNWDEEPIGNPEYSEFPWGLYCLKHNEHHLEWRLDADSPEELLVNDIDPELDSLISWTESGNSSLLVRVASLGLLAVGICLILALGLYFAVPEMQSYVGNASTLASSEPGLGALTGKYDVVLLPIKNGTECSVTHALYDSKTREQIETLSIRGGVEINVKIYKNGPCMPDPEELDELLEEKRPGLIVWGEVEEGSRNRTDVALQYAFKSSRDDISVYQMGNFSNTITGRLTGSRQERSILVDVVCWSLGMKLQEEERKNSYALAYLTRIQPGDGPSYDKVDAKLAQIYTEENKYELARHHYDRLLEKDHYKAEAFNGRGSMFAHMGDLRLAEADFDSALAHRPNYPQALFNRGVVHFKREAYEKAVTDLQKVVDLDHQNGTAYGVLAAIYAVKKEEDSLYQYLERSLETGQDVIPLVVNTSLKYYIKETRFQDLIKTYHAKDQF